MKRNRVLVLAVFVLVILGSVFGVLRKQGYHLSDIVGRPVALQARHLAVSLSHISDVLFLPYYFMPTRLPEYGLTMTFVNMDELNQALGEWDPDILEPLPNDRKIYTKAKFTADGETYNVDVRYRGDSPLHWAYFKKSWLIRFDDGKLFRGMSRLQLNVPEADSFYASLMNSHRAKKLGLISEGPFFVRLSLDGYDQGVYVASEDTTDEWAEKRALLGHVITYNGDGQDTTTTVWDEKNIARWEPDTLAASYSADAITALQQILTRADDETFRELAPVLIDLDSFYRWNIVEVMTWKHEQSDVPPSNNTKLFFDETTGKFSIIPHHLGIRERGTPVSEYEKETPLLAARILGIPEFLKERNRPLEEYLKNETAEDLKYYDDLVSSTRREFLGDFAKTSTSLEYLAEVRRIRSVMEENAAAARGELSRSYPPFTSGISARNLSLTKNYAGFAQVGESPQAFALKHPAFIYDGSQNTIRLPGGSYAFYENLIIPRGTRFSIEPGAKMFFAEGVSLISYSPVIAVGSPDEPIVISAINQDKPWGSFAVIGAGEAESRLRYLHVSYGSELHGMNGLSLTGMLAFPNSRVSISDSKVEHSKGEDALNPKNTEVSIKNTAFSSTLSDALDCDKCHGSIENNSFRTIGTGINQHKGVGNTGGDALDISFSDVIIQNNVIIGATDKGISVGERSATVIRSNLVAKNNIGIAVKDLSEAKISQNIIVKNGTGVELYKKKDIFGPAKAQIDGSVLWDNARETFAENDGSVLEFGDGNILQSTGGTAPDFSKLMPTGLFRELELSI